MVTTSLKSVTWSLCRCVKKTVSNAAGPVIAAAARMRTPRPQSKSRSRPAARTSVAGPARFASGSGLPVPSVISCMAFLASGSGAGSVHELWTATRSGDDTTGEPDGADHTQDRSDRHDDEPTRPGSPTVMLPDGTHQAGRDHRRGPQPPPQLRGATADRRSGEAAHRPAGGEVVSGGPEPAEALDVAHHDSIVDHHLVLGEQGRVQDGLDPSSPR